MAFSVDDEIIYTSSNGKYKGKVTVVNDKGHGVFTYDVHLTLKEGTDTTAQTLTKKTSGAKWNAADLKKENVLESSLKSA